MTWIRTIGYRQSEGALRKRYERLGAKHTQIDNILEAHSLRPATGPTDRP